MSTGLRSMLAFALLLRLAGPALGSEEPAPDAVMREVAFPGSLEPNRIFVDVAPRGNRLSPLMLDTGAPEGLGRGGPLAERAGVEGVSSAG